MSDSVPPPIEPGLLTNERASLAEFLDYFRSVLLRKGAGLTVDELSRPLSPTTLTIGRLIRHMTFVEDFWFSERIADTPLEPWASAPWDDDRDWEMTTADGMDFPTLRAEFEAACDRSREVMAQIESLDELSRGTHNDRPRNVRWVVVHMLEEYARHCGHADLLAEAIDGRVGD